MTFMYAVLFFFLGYPACPFRTMSRKDHSTCRAPGPTGTWSYRQLRIDEVKAHFDRLIHSSHSDTVFGQALDGRRVFLLTCRKLLITHRDYLLTGTEGVATLPPYTP